MRLPLPVPLVVSSMRGCGRQEGSRGLWHEEHGGYTERPRGMRVPRATAVPSILFLLYLSPKGPLLQGLGVALDPRASLSRAGTRN